MARLRERKLSTRLTYLVNLIALAFLVSSGLIIGGCKFSARAGSNSEDLREAQKVAEQFLQHLKDEKYDAAYELGASRLKSLITRESLQTDIQGRQRGGTVQSWTFKSHQITAVVPRQLVLLYHVQGSKTSGDVELTMELTEDPYQWHVWSVRPLNDAQAEQNAQQARIVAEQFLEYLKSHDYNAAQQLASPAGKSSTAQDLQKYWQGMEERHGLLKGWILKAYHDTTATITGGQRDYTMVFYQLQGSRSNAGAVFTMTKIGSAWRVEGVHFRDSF